MGLWSQARTLAEQTPPNRNRYVDFLRALSILVVVMGHWLIATAWMQDGELIRGHLLKDKPDIQWVTWLFQVMPVFFIVGGYSNAVSLASAARRGQGYAAWLIARLTRLAVPVIVLMLVWAGIALVMRLLKVDPTTIQYMSQASLIPTWFLAIYIMVALLAPLAWRFWQRTGYGSVIAFAGLAVAVDVLFFAFDLRAFGWSNYFWVWLAVHQLGFAWREGRLPSTPLLLLLAVVGFAALWLLIFKGPYPLAMVGSPDEGLSNTLPPKVTLIALALGQFGLLMALEAPLRRVLDNLRLWTFTVLVNSMIMTIYLWHITVMIVLGGVLYLAGGLGFGLEPGTAAWWLSRPLWLAALWALLLPLALLLSPLERRGRPEGAPLPGAPRQVVGAVAICLGIALLALYGFGDEPNDWIDRAAFALALGGALAAGLLVLPRRANGAR
jgi:peptidoglycan/LPS O-acetylase OafA/YrhL